MSRRTIVYVSIGNSDNGLTVQEWAKFAGLVAELFSAGMGFVKQLHGAWYSAPAAPYVNACWCVEFDRATAIHAVKAALRATATTYRQDSIAWAEVTKMEFLHGVPSRERAQSDPT